MNTKPSNPNNKSMQFYMENSIEFLSAHDFTLKQSALDSLDSVGENFLVSSLLGSVVVGTYFKIPLYRYMYAKFKEKSYTPIDILILVNGITQHCVCVLLTAVYGIGLTFDITFADPFGETWCHLPYYAGQIGAAYRTMGSLGIAIFRLLYIKCNFWLKEKFGIWNLFSIILTVSVFMTIGTAFGFATGNGPASRKQVFWNWCIGSSEEVREVEHNYSILTGNVSHQSDLLAKVSLLLVLAAVLAELGCYLALFSTLYTHDTGMLRKNILSVDVIKRRRQKNAVTFLGQFYGFIVEGITYVALMFTLQKDSNLLQRIAIVVGFWVEFGFASMVEVMTSQSLRQYLPHN